jgi:hypothetical protein
MPERSLRHWLTGAVRVLLRSLWSPLYVAWLRLRVAVWGSAAFEHAVAHCPPWLALRVLQAWGAVVDIIFSRVVAPMATVADRNYGTFCEAESMFKFPVRPAARRKILNLAKICRRP